jgi:hypothetical protein
VVQVTDYGDEMSNLQLKKLKETSVIRRVVKSMGGRLEANSTEHETNFVLTVPCKE